MARPKAEPDDSANAARMTASKLNAASNLSAASMLNAASKLLHSALSVPRSFFPPTAPLRIASHLVPPLVCLSLIPLVLFSSLFSGWYVWRNVAVGWQVPVYLQYGDGGSPYAEMSLPPLSTAQPYDISLHLVLPASEANFALGNFMATLSLSTPSNKSLMTVSRPSIALPPSRRTFSFSSIPRLFDLDVPLLSSYVPGASKVNARVELGRRDSWKGLGNGEGRELSVWNASLRSVVRRHGIRGLVSRFPLTFALASSAAFFSISLIVLAACILPAVQWRVSVDEMPNESELKEDKPVRIRRRPRKAVTSESRPQSTVYKSEDIVDVPSALTSDDYPLKRRRSHTSEVLLDSEN